MTTNQRLAEGMAHSWWLFLLRGVAAIVFGVLTLMAPAISLATLILFFGAYAFADGILGVWAAVAGRHENESWWVLLLWGLLGMLTGVLALWMPGVTALALLFYIAIWAVATGVLQIVAAVKLRKEIEGEWILGLAGLCSVVFGFLLAANPGVGALAVLAIIAGYAIAFGVLNVILAFKARSFGRRAAA